MGYYSVVLMSISLIIALTAFVSAILTSVMASMLHVLYPEQLLPIQQTILQSFLFPEGVNVKCSFYRADIQIYCIRRMHSERTMYCCESFNRYTDKDSHAGHCICKIFRRRTCQVNKY